MVETRVLAGSESGDADVNHQGKDKTRYIKPYFPNYDFRKGASKFGVSPDLGPMRGLQRRVHYQRDWGMVQNQESLHIHSKLKLDIETTLASISTCLKTGNYQAASFLGLIPNKSTKSIVTNQGKVAGGQNPKWNSSNPYPHSQILRPPFFLKLQALKPIICLSC